MNVLIVDDELNNRALVEKLLEKYSFINEVETANSAIAAMVALKTFEPDVVFLDVEMPGGNGFSFLDAVTDREFKVVFVTVHEKYAIEAVRAKADDYLIKPIDTVQFDELVLKLAGNFEDSEKKIDQNERIIVTTQDDTFFLKPKNIVRISSAGNYCIYHLANGKEIVASYILKKADQKLPKKMFARVHNSHIVNINSIEKISKSEGNFIVMRDGAEVPISRRRKEEFMTMIVNK